MGRADRSANFIMKVLILSCLLAVALGTFYDECKRSFEATDINHDGIIRPDEMSTVFTKTDANNDGNITAEEFTALHQPGTPEVNQGYFNYYDKLDGAADGVISMAVAQLLFDVFDAGNDGEITLEDWLAALTQLKDDIQNEILASYAD
ncbi:uncharacterized protein LOC112569335 isoform X1 [Pomacea canaliculata]|uniref:uncharacterized protein LOC112569335 isoform X1 n=2 Tax=Pomacea canaliculata TaxID=400727 RepID=UPI000D72C3CA|nr:uncharacterized protein LOC112569335 isoform X1 [Pomacea canaliculata]